MQSKKLYGVDTPAEKIIATGNPQKEFEGNLTVVTFPWVKAARKSPEQTGKEIGDWLAENEPAVNRYNVIKGFPQHSDRAYILECGTQPHH